MAKDKIYIQSYQIDGAVLKITTGSGTKYELSHKSCTCKGFGFRRNCGHMKEAKAKGLLAQLETVQKKKMKVSKSPTRTKFRKDAIRKFLIKNSVEFDETTIDNIEKHLTQDTTPDKVIQMAMSDMKAKKFLTEKK